MEQFLKEIHTISNLMILEEMKNTIKDKVTDMSLSWDERMILYKQVQLINQCITKLTVGAH